MTCTQGHHISELYGSLPVVHCFHPTQNERILENSIRVMRIGQQQRIYEETKLIINSLDKDFRLYSLQCINHLHYKYESF